MSIQEAYIVMYNFLDDYYCRGSENASLASLLSDMDPNIFSDKKLQTRLLIMIDTIVSVDM